MSKRNEILIAIGALLFFGSVLFWSITKLDTPDELIPIASISSDQPNVCILFQNNPVISLRTDIFDDQMASVIIKGQFKLSHKDIPENQQTRSFQGYLSFNPVGYLYEAGFDLILTGESKLKIKTEGTSSVKITLGIFKDGTAIQEKELLVNGPILHSKIVKNEDITVFNVLFPGKLSANLGAILGGSETGLKPEISKYFTARVAKDGEDFSYCDLAPIDAVIPFGVNIIGALENSISASEKQK